VCSHSNAQIYASVLRQSCTCRELTNAFRGFGIDARYVYSGTPVAERKALISSFKRVLSLFSSIVVIKYQLQTLGVFLKNSRLYSNLTEGTDIPNIDCVIVAGQLDLGTYLRRWWKTITHHYRPYTQHSTFRLDAGWDNHLTRQGELSHNRFRGQHQSCGWCSFHADTFRSWPQWSHWW